MVEIDKELDDPLSTYIIFLFVSMDLDIFIFWVLN